MRCSDEYEHNRGDDEPHRGSQAHHSQGGPESQLPGGQDKPIDFGAHKMRHVRLQFPDLLLQEAERFGWGWLLLAGRRMGRAPFVSIVLLTHQSRVVSTTTRLDYSEKCCLKPHVGQARASSVPFSIGRCSKGVDPL